MKQQPNLRVPDHAWCHRCEAVTPTLLAGLGCGHTANLCQACRSMRRGRPFVAKDSYLVAVDPSTYPAPHTGVEGAHHGRDSR